MMNRIKNVIYSLLPLFVVWWLVRQSAGGRTILYAKDVYSYKLNADSWLCVEEK